MEEEIEINFRLDIEGRTVIEGENTIDYATKTHTTQFVDAAGTLSISDAHFDELLLDCEISDSGLMPRTFWVGADTEPRCNLEQIAKDIFAHHTPSGTSFDPKSSGAEWWVQLRPSPETTGRYTMHGDKEDLGISFHWDKDEDLRLMCGGSTYVHPHLSTVTYLTSLGAPTLVAEKFRVHNLTGEWKIPEAGSSSAFLSWPATGKHLCFDGRFLHAAPIDLMESGAFAKQCETIADGDPKRLRRRHRRCTFLVNIWINHKPFNVNPFPDTMIDKMSGFDHQSMHTKTCGHKIHLSFMDETEASTACRVQCVSVLADSSVQVEVDDSDAIPCTANVQMFTWPVGDCESGESIQGSFPLSIIRTSAETGGNVRIRWPVDPVNDLGLCLLKREATSEEQCQKKRQRRIQEIDDEA